MQRLWIFVLFILSGAVLCLRRGRRHPKEMYSSVIPMTACRSCQTTRSTQMDGTRHWRARFFHLSASSPMSTDTTAAAHLLSDVPLTCASAGANVAEHNALFGPRVSAEVHGIRPFGEFLVGASHISRSNGISDSNTSFANAAGGGLDYRLAGPVSIRGQLDWIETRFYGQSQNTVRFSTGIAIHF